VWADAQLTPAGEGEALKANAFFKSHFAHDGFPYFQSYYSSPLTRCTTTADLTFRGIELPKSRPFKPIIKEYLREGISIHTCDRRSNKTYIHSVVPNFTFEKGFTENDELWRGTEGETADHQRARSKELLDDIFTNDDATWISITSHSGEIRRLLEVLGHRAFSLSTGQIIPVLVKAEVRRVSEEPTTTTTAPGFTAEATCTKPPITSIDGQGCVCSPTVVARAVLREI
jgi:broad specificity phosphatase PhoE